MGSCCCGILFRASRRDEDHIALKSRDGDTYNTFNSEYCQETAALIERTKNSPMLHNVVNNSLVGTKQVSQAALASVDGYIFATSDGFELTSDQVVALNHALYDPSPQKMNGIEIHDENFLYTEHEMFQYIYGTRRQATGGCIVRRTKNCLMIGVYDSKPDQAKSTMEELAEYLNDQGI